MAKSLVDETIVSPITIYCLHVKIALANLMRRHVLYRSILSSFLLFFQFCSSSSFFFSFAQMWQEQVDLNAVTGAYVSITTLFIKKAGKTEQNENKMCSYGINLVTVYFFNPQSEQNRSDKFKAKQEKKEERTKMEKDNKFLHSHSI